MDTGLNKTNAYILTGGQSRRFGEPKCLVQLDGKTLTEIIYDKLISIFTNVSIVGKENHFLKYNFVEDANSIQCPMNGIATALEHSNSDWIFVIACDLPLIKDNIISSIYDNIDMEKHAVVPSVDNQLQQLCALYHKSILKYFNSAIEKGDFSLMRLLNQSDILKIAIPFNDNEQFLNINYPEDLEKAEEVLNK